jgi:hypothetical protein
MRRRFPIIVNGEIRFAEVGRDGANGISAATSRTIGRNEGGCSALKRRVRTWPWWRPLSIAVFIVAGLIVLFGIRQVLGPQWGPVAIICVGIGAVFAGLGTRKAGTLSAYSIFNNGFERLPGQLSAADIDREIRGGGGMAGPRMPRRQSPPPPQGRGHRLDGDVNAGGVHDDDAGGADNESDEERQLQMALQRSLQER